MTRRRTGPAQPWEFATVRVGGLETAVVTRAELAQRMVDDVLAGRDAEARPARLVFSSNGQGISLAAVSPHFAEAMACADVIHADGMSVVLASRLLTTSPLPERVATTDFFHDAARAAQSSGVSFYFLGASEEENAGACATVARLYPDLKIAGRHHGYFDTSDDARICEAVVAGGTDVLWVGLGRPKQEFWSLANRERLRSVAWIKTCGGLYGFLSGRSRRAPAWMQRGGLEWAFRGLQEPSRLGWRYLVTNPHALWRMAVDSRPAARRPSAIPAGRIGSRDGI